MRTARSSETPGKLRGVFPRLLVGPAAAAAAGPVGRLLGVGWSGSGSVGWLWRVGVACRSVRRPCPGVPAVRPPAARQSWTQQSARRDALSITGRGGAGRVGPGRAEPSRAEPSRAELGRLTAALVTPTAPLTAPRDTLNSRPPHYHGIRGTTNYEPCPWFHLSQQTFNCTIHALYFTPGSVICVFYAQS